MGNTEVILRGHEDVTCDRCGQPKDHTWMVLDYDKPAPRSADVVCLDCLTPEESAQMEAIV